MQVSQAGDGTLDGWGSGAKTSDCSTNAEKLREGLGCRFGEGVRGCWTAFCRSSGVRMLGRVANTHVLPTTHTCWHRSIF
jgi:hypothetical protein